MCSKTLTLLILAFTGLTACTASTTFGQAVSPSSMQQSPERYVVVTVHNDPRSLPLNAASSSRSYDGTARYTVSAAARRLSRAIASDHDLTEAGAWPIAVLGVHCLVYRIADAADRSAVLDALLRDARVESAQPLETFSTQGISQSTVSAGVVDMKGYNDPYAKLQNNLLQLGVPETQKYSQGEGIKVAIIDTGIDSMHPDLRERVALERNFVDKNAEQFHRDAHGTAVAGVIAAVINNAQGIAGIAPASHLLALKACWQSADGKAAHCNSFTLAQALAAAIDARADVVNLSLAGPSDPLLTRLVKIGSKQGIIFVGAVPPGDSLPGFPGEIETVLGVNASEEHRLESRYLAAPGRDIFTLTPAGHYDAVSGSSLAAAEVSGVIALLRARHARLTAEQAQAALMHSTRPASASMSSVDACVALALLDSRVRCAEYAEVRSHTSW